MSRFKYRRPRILDRIALDQHGLIEASAGTGKTFTIENLVIELLVNTPATIDQILAVTFTEKATSELRARIRSTIESAISGAEQDQAPADELRTLDDNGRRKLEEALFAFDRAPVFTIHGFCHRTLSELSFPSGMRFSLEVTDKEIAFHEAFRAELRELGRDEHARALLREWCAAEHKIERLEELLVQANRGRYLSTIDYRSHLSMNSQERATLALEARMADEFLPRIAERMYRLKQERGVLDYDDMLEWLARALEGKQGDALVALIRKRYRHALIDEFQDTDDSQWRIFRRVFITAPSGENCLHIVGDPKQAIYAFRGADVHSYLEAKRELIANGVAAVPLVENFRATRAMVEAVNVLLKQDEPDPFFDGEIRYDFPVTCGRAELRAVNASNIAVSPVTLMRLSGKRRLSAAVARSAVAGHIANAIRSMLNTADGAIRVSGKEGNLEPVRAGGIFVLTRTNSESQTIGKFLRAANVPFAFYKQEGLFQTREAGDIADALKGVLEPGVQSRRLKAWATPFFSVPYSELPRAVDLPPSHRLVERLYEWKALADKEQFAELFDAMLHRSGLVDRELFFSNSERELTNYLHIFEILLHKAVTRGLSLDEIIALLEEYILNRALPDGEDSDVQRLESERAAVQVMTIHKSKGLEADVVFLFGGTHGGNQRGLAAVFHRDGKRRVAIGADAMADAKAELGRESREENQRLMYVAMTRARAKLYVPFFPDGSIWAMSGPYSHINRQLKRLENATSTNFFEIQDVQEPEAGGQAIVSDLKASLAKWNPPAELMDDSQDRDAASAFANISGRHVGLEILSYTQLRARLDNSASGDYGPEDFKTTADAIDARAGAGDLPGGRNVGIFLHEAIERLNFQSLAESPDFGSWNARGDVRDLFAASMRRHSVRDERWFDRGRQIVFNALTSRLALGTGDSVEGLHRLPFVREMEFDYPIPEETHPLLSRPPTYGAWTTHSGYVKGFIDFVFNQQGKTYFADWKSDLLPSYQPEPVEQHVALHYELQAQIYSIGVIRLLGIRSESEYSERFGGLLYLFLRGISATDSKAGIYFVRPAWSDIVEYEAALIRPDAGRWSSQ